MRLSATRSLTRTPFTVIGGFLGAGKTTLVNHLLARAQGRYAILVNDFGAVNVDARLIAEHSGETLRLSNGCVCCSLNDDFVGTLARVLDVRGAFDHIFVEASGVADPRPIADIARLEPDLRFNATVTLADAGRIAGLMTDPRLAETARRQVEGADLLLLNKIDLVSHAELREARAALIAVNSKLRVVEAVGATLPVDVITNGRDTGEVTRFQADAPQHEHAFRRFLFRRNLPFEREALNATLARLPSDLLRLKGLCRIADDGASFTLQWALGRWSLEPSEAGDDIATELVGIGTADLAIAEATTLLEGALVQDNGA